MGGVLALLVGSTSLFALTRKETPPAAPTPIYELAAADVLKVTPQPLTRSLRLSGTLSPVRHAMVKAHSGGIVMEVRAQEGDRVRRGAVLVRMDPRNLQAELDARQAALRKAQADSTLAAKNRDNSVILLKEKLISQNAFDQTVATHESAIASQEGAMAQLRLAQLALDETEIRADFDGIVAARDAQVGERAAAGALLLSLVDLSQMQLEALVPVADIPAVRVGVAARFHVDGFGERQFAGRVERISPQTEQGTRSLTVYVSVDNADSTLKGGMFADGQLVLAQTAPVLAVPSSAIHKDQEGAYVLSVKEGSVVRLPVVTGAEYGDSGMTVVDEGVAEATHVIVAPATTLKPGARAKLAANS